MLLTGRDALDDVEDLQERRAAANERAPALPARGDDLGPGAERAQSLGRDGAPLHGALHRAPHVTQADGLLQHVLHTAPHGLDRRVHVGERRDEDGRHFRLHDAQPLEEVQAIESRHDQVGEDEIDRVVLRERERLLAVLRGDHLVAVACEPSPEGLATVAIVVDDEDDGDSVGRCGHRFSSGTTCRCAHYAGRTPASQRLIADGGLPGSA